MNQSQSPMTGDLMYVLHDKQPRFHNREVKPLTGRCFALFDQITYQTQVRPNPPIHNKSLRESHFYKTQIHYLPCEFTKTTVPG